MATTNKLALGREVTQSIAGTAAFGAAACAGLGLPAMARGAALSPALFVGGALLATPPLYLFSSLSGGRITAAQAAGAIVGPLSSVGTALLGLALPAAYLSITLRTSAAPLLLAATVSLAGLAGVLAVVQRAGVVEKRDGARMALMLWGLFAVLLGGRLLQALAPHLSPEGV